MKRNDFPQDFVWGTATAAYQIEGAASEDGRSPSIWDTFSHTPGRVKGGDTGDVACDHYHRYPQDTKLMKGLGIGAYRFSVSWPRVLPGGRGDVNEKGLEFYDRLVDGLLEANITPWVTLYHWDLPQTLQDEGGWGNRDTAQAFVDYADVVSRRLGDRVKHWITHNEPWVVAFLGHQWGVHAPGLRDPALALRVSHHLLLSHGLAVPVLRRNVPDSRVGITLNLAPAHPASPSPEDIAATRLQDGFQNRWFLDPLYGFDYPVDMLEAYGSLAPDIREGDLDTIAVHTDFLGINYYSRAVVRHEPSASPLPIAPVRLEAERTFFDWEVYPDGLREIIVRVGREYRPGAIYITENGATYEDELDRGEVRDTDRQSYLERHFAKGLEAVREGAPLKGYFLWSLLDNFEWAEGYEKRFGITYVDFDTQQRTLKGSGRWYSDFLHGAD